MSKETKFKFGYLISLTLIAIIATSVYWALEVRKPSSYSICLQGFNHTERWIHEYSVNGQWGGNISPKEPDTPYGGGGGLSCGGTVGGNPITVVWKFSNKTREEMAQGVPLETHKVSVPMPEAESNRSRYFQVHIFPDNHVELKLLDLP